MPLLRSGGAVFHVFLAVTNIVLYIIFNFRVRPEGKPPPGPLRLAAGDRAAGGTRLLSPCPADPAVGGLGARGRLSGLPPAGSDTGSPGEIFSGFSLREAAPARGFSSSSPRPFSPTSGGTKPGPQLATLPPPLVPTAEVAETWFFFT